MGEVVDAEQADPLTHSLQRLPVRFHRCQVIGDGLDADGPAERLVVGGEQLDAAGDDLADRVLGFLHVLQTGLLQAGESADVPGLACRRDTLPVGEARRGLVDRDSVLLIGILVRGGRGPQSGTQCAEGARVLLMVAGQCGLQLLDRHRQLCQLSGCSGW
ncbi:hypothetical protein [Nocardia sp. NPDC055049]